MKVNYLVRVQNFINACEEASLQCALFIQIISDVRVVPKCRALGAPIRNRGCETKRRGDNMRIRRAHYENLIAALPRATFHAPRVQRAASASVKRRAAARKSLSAFPCRSTQHHCLPSPQSSYSNTHTQRRAICSRFTAFFACSGAT
jgi:hypothetical protein